MIDNKMVEELVREVLKSMAQAPQAVPVTSAGLSPEQDYPLAAKRPELIKTPSGKKLSDITLDKVMQGEIAAEDVRITPATLKLQALIADGVGRNQFANNLRRAAELTAIPDNRVLEIYNALRPYRSTKKELLAIAEELAMKYNANISAAFVREAADVYERRNRLRAE